MTIHWGRVIQLCLANVAIGGLAALPVNLFNRLMTVELALPAILPGLLVALHYAVQLSRPVWGHRSDLQAGRSPFIIGGIAVVGLGLIITAWGIATPLPIGFAIAVWVLAYALIGVGIGAAGTSFLALLASSVSDERKGAAATIAWLSLIIGAIVTSIGAGIALDPYSPARLIIVVACVAGICVLLAMAATWRVERLVASTSSTANRTKTNLSQALKETWSDADARAFTGFVVLSILAFYLSELILEPFAGHIHGLTPDESTSLSGGKDGAALLGMLMAGGLSVFAIGSLRFWAVTGCVISAFGLLGLSAGLQLLPFVIVLGFGNGLFVVGAIGSMMRLASARKGATGTRMGVFGAAQAIAAGVAGLIATGTVDLARWVMPLDAAYATVFIFEALLFLLAAVVAGRLLGERAAPSFQRENAHV